MANDIDEMAMFPFFRAALQDAILNQKREGIICRVCGKTRVEHYYKGSTTCGSLREFGGEEAGSEGEEKG